MEKEQEQAKHAALNERLARAVYDALGDADKWDGFMGEFSLIRDVTVDLHIDFNVIAQKLRSFIFEELRDARPLSEAPTEGYFLGYDPKYPYTDGYCICRWGNACRSDGWFAIDAQIGDDWPVDPVFWWPMPRLPRAD